MARERIHGWQRIIRTREQLFYPLVNDDEDDVMRWFAARVRANGSVLRSLRHRVFGTDAQQAQACQKLRASCKEFASRLPCARAISIWQRLALHFHLALLPVRGRLKLTLDNSSPAERMTPRGSPPDIATPGESLGENMVLKALQNETLR